MPAVIHTLHRFVAEYGRALLLALLVHALILTLQQSIEATLPDHPVANEHRMADELVEQIIPSYSSTGNLLPELKSLTTTTDAANQNPISTDKTKLVNGASLAQRALKKATEPDFVAVDQAGNGSAG